MPEKEHSFTYHELKRPVIIAHRGSSAHAPENTLAAFKLAVQQQAAAIELDVKLSADGQVVVIHDDTVDRTTNGTGKVSSMTLAELKQLNAGSKFVPEYQSERIPTLAQVFETVGNQIFINVEIKNYTSPTDDLSDKVISLVKEYGLETSVMLSSFNMIALIRARALMAQVPLGLITIKGMAGLTIRSKLVLFGPLLAFHPHYLDVTAQLIEATHQAGAYIHTYTVNQPDLMRQLFTSGVDGIFTDDPVLAQKVLIDI
jgi:glycerophosphoryl diester phosphodiesterase